MDRQQHLFDPHPWTLRQLQYAVAVAQTLSFRQAAERCHVSQPSLSAQIAELERALGVQLFERDRRRVLVTPSGRGVVERARAVLREADDLRQSVRRSANPLVGALRIGVIPTISPYLLPHITPPLRAAFPQLTLLWVEDKTPALVRGLDTGMLDAALLALEAELGDVEQQAIARDPFVLVAPPGRALVGPAALARASDLRGASVLLLDDEHCFGRQALAFCSTAKAHELEFRATSLTTIAQMVAAGNGVTLLPRLAVPIEARGAQLRVRAFAEPAPGRTIGLIWRRRSPLRDALRQLALTIQSAYPTADLPQAQRGARRPRRQQ